MTALLPGRLAPADILLFAARFIFPAKPVDLYISSPFLGVLHRKTAPQQTGSPVYPDGNKFNLADLAEKIQCVRFFDKSDQTIEPGMNMRSNSATA
jgi:hypothetical protein